MLAGDTTDRRRADVAIACTAAKLRFADKVNCALRIGTALASLYRNAVRWPRAATAESAVIPPLAGLLPISGCDFARRRAPKNVTLLCVP